LFWLFFGWLADYAFPFGQALELMLACFQGTVSAKTNTLQKQLQKIEIISQIDNKNQVQKLNSLESQAWLYRGILESLGSDSSVNHDKIAKTIEALEYKRAEILQELKPRRPKKYQFLASLQESARHFLPNQARNDYEQIQNLISNLITFTSNRKASSTILLEVIEKLDSEIIQKSDKISSDRLRLVYRIDQLMKAISKKMVSNEELLRSSIGLLSNEFNGLLRSREENQARLKKLECEIENQRLLIKQLNKQLELQLQKSRPKIISEKEKISEQEYKEISNQDEYEPVKGHFRKNGKWVELYYRRKRSSRRNKQP
jgi:hypothetical protein